MSSEKDCISVEDIVPGDPITTVWRYCSRNGWAFVPDLLGGEPLIAIEAANAIVTPGNQLSSAKAGILSGVKRYPGGLVRLSEVVALKGEA